MANATCTVCIYLAGTYVPPHLLWPTLKLSKERLIVRGRPMILTIFSRTPHLTRRMNCGPNRPVKHGLWFIHMHLTRGFESGGFP